MNKHEIQALAEELIEQHLNSRRRGYGTYWVFKFTRSVRVMGHAELSSRTIALSAPLMTQASEADVRDTILHEIAHALVGPVRRGQGHGWEWQEMAVRLGAKPEANGGEDIPDPPKPFQGTCPNCARKIRRYKRTKIACGTCCKKYNGGDFDADYLFSWARVAVAQAA